MMKKRLSELRKKMKKEKIDAAIFLSVEPIDDPNIYYFTGFRQMRNHSFACFLVTQKKTVLVLSSLDYERATGKEADEIVKKERPLSQILKDYIKNNHRIGVIESMFPYKLSKKFGKIKDTSDIIGEMRSVKDKKEIENIRKACRIANFGIKFIMENLQEGMRERELALALERKMIRMGADEIAFPTVVTSSLRSCQIHPFPTFSNQKIKRGLGFVDFGAGYNGYCSDVTVPFGIGKLTKKEMKIVKTVKEAYKKSVEKLKQGIPTWKLYETAEKIIKEGGFEFKHSLGHGLGLETHDFPSISSKPREGRKEIKIHNNMVFTIEPGVYVSDVGGCRLENDFLMKRRNFEVLTKSRFLKI